MSVNLIKKMGEAINKRGNYVVIPLLPTEQIEPFTKWIYNQTVPEVEQEGEYANQCAWLWDYEQWHRAWSVRGVADILD